MLPATQFHNIFFLCFFPVIITLDIGISFFFFFNFQNGARALMLDTYDFRNDVWLCHSFKGQCHDYTAFVCILNPW